MSASLQTATIHRSVTQAVGDERVERILHREQQVTLNGPFLWREYDRVEDLPERPLDGWEELLVFTDTRVYRWLETGYTRGPTVVPRNPETVVPEPSFMKSTPQD